MSDNNEHIEKEIMFPTHEFCTQDISVIYSTVRVSGSISVDPVGFQLMPILLLIDCIW